MVKQHFRNLEQKKLNAVSSIIPVQPIMETEILEAIDEETKSARDLERQIIEEKLVRSEVHEKWRQLEQQLKQLNEEFDEAEDPEERKELMKKIDDVRAESNRLYDKFSILIKDEVVAIDDAWEEEFYRKIKDSDRYSFRTLEQVEKEKGKVEKIVNPFIDNLFSGAQPEKKAPIHVWLSEDGEKAFIRFDNFGPNGRKVDSWNHSEYDDYMSIVREKYHGRWNYETRSYIFEVNQLENILGALKRTNLLLDYAIVGKNQTLNKWKKIANIPKELIIENETRHMIMEVKGNEVIIKSGADTRAGRRVQEERVEAYLNRNFAQKIKKRKITGQGMETVTYPAAYRNPEGELVIPIGLLSRAYWYIEGTGFMPAVADTRPRSPVTNPEFRKGWELWDFQKRIVAEALIEGQGLIVSPTGSGKTIMAAGIISGYINGAEKYEKETGRKVDTDSLFFVHRNTLGDQAEAVFEELLEKEVGRLDKKNFHPQLTEDSDINVATIQGMYKALKKRKLGEKLTEQDKLMLDVLKEAEVIFQDEAHHIIAESFDEVYSENETIHKYGLTATPSRRQQEEILRVMKIGEVRRAATLKELQEMDPPRLMRPKVIEYKIPPYPEYSKWRFYGLSWWEKIRAQVENNELRNKLIIDQAKDFDDKHKTTIIFTTTRNHAKKISELLKNQHDIEAPILTGDKKRSYLKEKINDLRTGETNIAVATSALLGEGFDLPNLDVIQIANPATYSKIQVIQKAGRVMRTDKGKEQPIIIEYNDEVAPFNEHMEKRRMHYKDTEAFDYEEKPILEKYFKK
jgi:superfamily II DNA or RNA helicase